MGGQYSVNALADVLDFLFTSGAIGKDIAKDGKIGILELVKLAPLIPKVLKLGGELSQIPKELSELDQEDQAKLLAIVSARLPQLVDSARAQLLVNLYLKAIIALVEALSMTFAPAEAEVAVAAV